jgi:hypothetical protein
MKINPLAVAYLLVAAFSVKAADETVPLTPGDYLLVYGSRLTETRVSFRKSSDGKLTFSCPDASASPSAVLQQGDFFQFSIVYADPKESSLRSLVFMGTGQKENSSEKFSIRGLFTEVRAFGPPKWHPHCQNGEQGSFLLKKLPDSQ